MEKPQTWFAELSFDTSNSGKFTDVSVFLVYLLLRSNTTSAIIEERAMIVIPIKA